MMIKYLIDYRGEETAGQKQGDQAKIQQEMEVAWISMMEKVVVRSGIWHILER